MTHPSFKHIEKTYEFNFNATNPTPTMTTTTFYVNLLQLLFLLLGSSASTLVLYLLFFRGDKSRSARDGQKLVCLADVFWQILCTPVILYLIINRRLPNMEACQVLGVLVMGASITSYTLIAGLSFERYKNILRINKQEM